ncbi:MAG: LITAF-like zinc ribbon domain-containing protein [Pseudomonadota bacterium]
MADENRDSAACIHCQTRMELLHVKKYPGGWPAVLVVAGVFCCFFFIGPLVGIPLLLLGMYTATAKETISLCPKCGHYFKVWIGEKGSV